MLRILDIEPVSTGKVMTDSYIPLQFKPLDRASLFPCLWWRTGNFKTSLLEVIIDANRHNLNGVTLTSFPRRPQHGLPAGYADVATVQGVPVVDISMFPDKSGDPRRNRWEERVDFEIWQRENAFYIVFDPSYVPEKCMRTDRIGFFQAGEYLCGIGFFDLSPEEFAQAMALLPPKWAGQRLQR